MSLSIDNVQLPLNVLNLKFSHGSSLIQHPFSPPVLNGGVMLLSAVIQSGFPTERAAWLGEIIPILRR